MTKIIINGVDVSGCEHFENEDMEMVCGLTDDCSACKGRDCYYKQRQRKTAECERLKEKLKPKLKNAHCVYFEGQTGMCRAKEFKRCNPVNCKLYTIDELSTILDLQKQLATKTAECERLKNVNKELMETTDGLIDDNTRLNAQLHKETTKCKNNEIAYKNDLEIINQECFNLKQELDDMMDECDEKENLIKKFWERRKLYCRVYKSLQAKLQIATEALERIRLEEIETFDMTESEYETEVHDTEFSKTLTWCEEALKRIKNEVFKYK